MMEHIDRIVSVFATFADEEEAARIGRLVVEDGLAACANILGACRSIYRWQENIEDNAEVAVLFKTARASADALVARIAALHSYAVPAAVIWPIEGGFPPYIEWVEAGAGASR